MPIELFEGYNNALLKFAAIACILFIVLGVPGNLLTILALCYSKKNHNSTAIFIMNLSLADLLFGCFNLPLAASTFLKRSWTHGDLLCRLFPLLRYALLAVSLFMISLITINRYIIIVHPRSYARIYKRRYLYTMILSTWLISFSIMLPTWHGIWGRFGLDLDIGSCTILPDQHNHSPKEFLFAMAFILPCLCIIFCYTSIFLIVRRATLRSRDLPGQLNAMKASAAENRYDDVAPRMKLRVSQTVPIDIHKITDITENLSAFTVKENFRYIDDNCSLDKLPINLLSSSLRLCDNHNKKLMNNNDDNNNNNDNDKFQMPTERDNKNSSDSNNLNQKILGPSSAKSKNNSTHRFHSRHNYSSIRYNISNASSSAYPGRMSQKDRHLLIMILIIFITFVICYLPITITKILKRTQQNHFINISSYLLIYITTCINPIIYVMISTEYRQAYSELLKCFYGKWNRNKIDHVHKINGI